LIAIDLISFIGLLIDIFNYLTLYLFCSFYYFIILFFNYFIILSLIYFILFYFIYLFCRTIATGVQTIYFDPLTNIQPVQYKIGFLSLWFEFFNDDYRIRNRTFSYFSSFLLQLLKSVYGFKENNEEKQYRLYFSLSSFA